MTQNIMRRCRGMQKDTARLERVPKSMIVLLSATIHKTNLVSNWERSIVSPNRSRWPVTRAHVRNLKK